MPLGNREGAARCELKPGDLPEEVTIVPTGDREVAVQAQTQVVSLWR